MPKQKGIIPLQGTMGNISFYKGKNGYFAREKGGVDGDRIATDPAYARTRENGEEFGRAGKASKMLRTSVRALLQKAGDPYVTSRLTAAFLKVIKADATSARGKRNVIDGEAEMLTGFEFNSSSPLQSVLFAPYTTNIDRATGALTVSLEPFIPINMIAAPPGATHCVISCAGAEIDFEAQKFVNGVANSGELVLNATPTAELNLSVNISANSTKPIFLSLGIEFFQKVGGTSYSLNNGIYNALALVAVSGTA
jgi:hypothetical protein